MTNSPNATMQFVTVEPLDERDLKIILDHITNLQKAVIQLQNIVVEIQRREINRL